MSGNLNKVLFLFVGLFLTFLLVAFILGRFNLRPKNTTAMSGSLREALGLKAQSTPTPSPANIAVAPSVLLPTKIPNNQGTSGMVLGQTNPTPAIVEMRYAPPSIPNTGIPTQTLIGAFSLFGAGVYLVRKNRD